ncbi:MAG: hypothetical protein Q4D85_11900 [Corynebacterium sp.]|uniref:hypothetical protein n=1 Tax=Corynebacterium sp. TaxID=1720 RepID=UPI0026DC1876|nr:hypothetical protein [Corynebacterium sp.]MDO5099439.1 hypothetical protein [Corynebacterium sp.]
MTIDAIFFPTLQVDSSLFVPGFARFEDDPYFRVTRFVSGGVEYVLVTERVAELWWLSPQLRWRLAGNRVLDVALRWETIGGGRDFGVRDDETFSWIDGFDVVEPVQFVSQWNERFGGDFRAEADKQVWNADNSVSVTGSVGIDPQWPRNTVTWFNPEVESNRRDPRYFRSGEWDDPAMVERYLEDCVWGQLATGMPQSLYEVGLAWPQITKVWPEIADDVGQQQEVLLAVVGFIYADGRFTVTDGRTGKLVGSPEAATALIQTADWVEVAKNLRVSLVA